jgi:hypothetical protein
MDTKTENFLSASHGDISVAVNESRLSPSAITGVYIASRSKSDIQEINSEIHCENR